MQKDYNNGEFSFGSISQLFHVSFNSTFCMIGHCLYVASRTFLFLTLCRSCWIFFAKYRDRYMFDVYQYNLKNIENFVTFLIKHH
jgi:hypothetical protein